MAYALLLGTLGKIDPQAAKACEKVIGKIPLIDHSPWPKHQRCELNPDLDNTSHFLASSNTKPAKTAWRPPKHGRHIPCNALIATQKGQGVAAIRNADHDGDEFGFSNDPRLLEIHDATPEGAGIEEFLRVEAEVTDTLSRAPAHRLKGVAAFRKFCLSVDILPVRGIACAMVEKVLCHILLNRPTHAKMAAWYTASRWVRAHMQQTMPPKKDLPLYF